MPSRHTGIWCFGLTNQTSPRKIGIGTLRLTELLVFSRHLLGASPIDRVDRPGGTGDHGRRGERGGQNARAGEEFAVFVQLVLGRELGSMDVIRSTKAERLPCVARG